MNEMYVIVYYSNSGTMKFGKVDYALLQIVYTTLKVFSRTTNVLYDARIVSSTSYFYVGQSKYMLTNKPVAATEITFV